MTAEQIVSRILYRDGLMLVIDKPPGIAVHKGPKGGDSLEDCFGALRFGLLRAPALAHRLDRDTSGCLVLGRHRKPLAALGRLFTAGRGGKTSCRLTRTDRQSASPLRYLRTCMSGCPRADGRAIRNKRIRYPQIRLSRSSRTRGLLVQRRLQPLRRSPIMRLATELAAGKL